MHLYGPDVLAEKSVLDVITVGFLASLVAGLATGLGALTAPHVQHTAGNYRDGDAGISCFTMTSPFMIHRNCRHVRFAPADWKTR